MNGTGASYVKEYLYTGDSSKYHGGAIKYDLDWVASNWESSGCDLWEEVQSDDFFWFFFLFFFSSSYLSLSSLFLSSNHNPRNRYNFRYGLTVGAMVAEKMGDNATANHWRSVADQIKPTVAAHYNGKFVYESTNREKDTATICGFNVGFFFFFFFFFFFLSFSFSSLSHFSSN